MTTPESPTYPVPIADHLLLRPIVRDLEIGGMARPEAQAEMPSEGIVLRVGPGRVTETGVRVPPEVAPGDLVSFPSYAGKLVIDPPRLEPGTYLLVRQDEIYLNHGPETESEAI